MSDTLDLTEVSAIAAEAFGKELPKEEPAEQPVVEQATEQQPVEQDSAIEPQPTAEQPAAAEQPVAETNEPAAIHPAWQKALDTVPEVFRAPLIEQIRTSDRESQAAIEKARAEAKEATDSVPAEWREFLAQHKESGLTPAQVQQSLTAAEAIQQDPIGFLEVFQSRVRDAVQAGQISAPQGKELVLGVAQQVAAAQQPEPGEDAFDLRTDAEKARDAEFEQMKQQLAAMTAQREQEAAARAQQTAQEEANAYAREVVAKLETLVPNATQDQRVTVGTLADALIARANGQLTIDAGIQLAVQQLTAQGMVFAAAPVVPAPTAQPAPTLAPAGGALPANEPVKFENESQRTDAMLKAGLAALAQQQ